MTWGELKEVMKDVPDNFEIIIASDAEGNSFSPLSECWMGVYIPDTDWYGDIVMADDLEEDEELNCAILWPTN